MVRECQNCGAHVTTRFVRVFGSDDGCVERCQECAPAWKLKRGAAAGLATERGRAGRWGR